MARKMLRTYNALNTAKVGTRVMSPKGFTVRRVTGGWRYESSTAPGVFQHHEMVEQGPFLLLEVVPPHDGTPPAPHTPPRVIGRAFWDPTHPTPWVSFDGITAYNRWAADMRKELPGLKTEYARLDWISPDTLLRSAARKAAEYRS